MMGNEGGGRAACSTTYGEQTGACGSHLALDQLAPWERPYPWSQASVLGSSSATETVETRGHGPYPAPRTGTEKDFIQRQTSGVPRP